MALDSREKYKTRVAPHNYRVNEDDYIGAEIHLAKVTYIPVFNPLNPFEQLGDYDPMDNYPPQDVFRLEADFRRRKDGKGIHVGMPVAEGETRNPWMDLTLMELKELFGSKAVGLVNHYGCKHLED